VPVGFEGPVGPGAGAGSAPLHAAIPAVIETTAKAMK